MEKKRKNASPAGKKTDQVFRRYAGYGFHRRRLKVFEAYEAMRGCASSEEEALDMLAVFDMLRLLELSGRRECAEAVRHIYFAGGGRKPRKNEISERVRRFALESHYDDRSIYRQLRKAKDTYLQLRGHLKDT